MVYYTRRASVSAKKELSHTGGGRERAFFCFWCFWCIERCIEGFFWCIDGRKTDAKISLRRFWCISASCVVRAGIYCWCTADIAGLNQTPREPFFLFSVNARYIVSVFYICVYTQTRSTSIATRSLFCPFTWNDKIKDLNLSFFFRNSVFRNSVFRNSVKTRTARCFLLKRRD